MRWGSRARSKVLLTIAACRDVVERVRSMCILLSLISAARHPLHISFFFVVWKENSHVKKIAVFTFLSLTLWLFSNWFFFSLISLLHLFFKIHFSWQIKHFFFFSFVFVEMNILYQPYLHRPHRDQLSYVTVSWQYWENVGMTRTNREV